MLILGLHGQAGCGKSTVAEYLAAHYGFVQFAFSDSLYHECQEMFGLANQSLLRDRVTKELPSELLTLDQCRDDEFCQRVRSFVFAENGHDVSSEPFSPRQILQWVGTEYRRAQDPDYWVKRAAEFVTQMYQLPPYPELRPTLFVECGTRFENERDWIVNNQHLGQIWHIHRDATDHMTDPHASAQPLPILPGERELWNNSTIEELHLAVDLLLSSSVQFVRCEPMDPKETPDGQTPQ